MIDSKKIITEVSSFLHRFHVMLFVIVMLGGLATLIFFLNTVLANATDTTKTPLSSQESFDQATIQRIEELNTNSDNTADIKFPSGRINPFVE